MKKKPIDCMIIEDEPISIQIISSYIQKIPFLNLRYICEDAYEALEVLNNKNNNIDVIFSDIDLPRLNGIDFIKSIEKKIPTIFISGYQNYALEGFNIGVIDFLSKPITFDRFLLAVNRCVKEINNNTTKHQEFLFIKTLGKLQKININDIIYIETSRDYLIFHTTSFEYKSLMSMKSFEQQYNIPVFLKIQRSFIINITHINSINGNIIELSNKKNVTISNKNKDLVYNNLQIKNN